MTASSTIPGYEVGTWDIDPAHSAIEFSVRHMGIAKTKGRFTAFSGELVTAENPLDSSVTATISTGSIDTAMPDRDAHVRNADFLDVANYPTATFRSTGIRQEDDEFVIDGEFTLHGVTKPVSLRTELNGISENGLIGLSATTALDRRDFGVGPDNTAVVGDKIKVSLEIEAERRP